VLCGFQHIRRDSDGARTGELSIKGSLRQDVVELALE
jgi:hypothetical protein